MDASKINELEASVKAANSIRDENLMLLKTLYETVEPAVKINIIKTMNDLLKSKEDSTYSVIKASLLNEDVNSNIDYKKAAVEMLKTISPKDIVSGKLTVNPNADAELEAKFANSENNKISDSELSLED